MFVYVVSVHAMENKHLVNNTGRLIFPSFTSETYKHYSERTYSELKELE